MKREGRSGQSQASRDHKNPPSGMHGGCFQTRTLNIVTLFIAKDIQHLGVLYAGCGLHITPVVGHVDASLLRVLLLHGRDTLQWLNVVAVHVHPVGKKTFDGLKGKEKDRVELLQETFNLVEQEPTIDGTTTKTETMTQTNTRRAKTERWSDSKESKETVVRKVGARFLLWILGLNRC